MGSVQLKRTDYRSMSSTDLEVWVEQLATTNNKNTQLWHYWHAKSAEEKLLAAIVTDIFQLNGSQFPHLNLSSVVFTESKTDLVLLDNRWNQIKVSRYGMADWYAVLTATLQEVATVISGDHKRGQSWTDYALALGISLAPVEFIFREPFGSQGTVKTPYGPLHLVFGRDSITAPDGSWSGVPISITKSFVNIEDRTGRVHRIHGEEIHPNSGNISKILQLKSKRRRFSYSITFGKAYVDQDGKRFYALYQISKNRVKAISSDGERRDVQFYDLSL